MEYVTYEVNDRVGIITINREKALNALNSQVLDELSEAFDGVDLSEIRCLILTGAGEKSFVAGADIGEMSNLSKSEGEAFGKKGNDLFRKIETFPIPVTSGSARTMRYSDSPKLDLASHPDSEEHRDLQDLSPREWPSSSYTLQETSRQTRHTGSDL